MFVRHVFQTAIHVTEGKKGLLSRTPMDPPLEKTHNSLPDPKSLQLLEWSEAQEGGIRCHVGRRPRGPCSSLAPGCRDRPAACKAGNPLSQHHPLRAHTPPSPIVPGSLMVSQCTYSSKKEACGQHSSIAEAKLW